MAVSKVILDGTTLIDLTDDTADASKVVASYTATGNDGVEYTGSIPTRTSSNMTVSGKTVTAPAGYYASNQSKNVADGAYSASVSSHSITTMPVVTGSLSGTGTNIGTTTKPSGTDGTNYWTYTPSGSVTTTGVSTAKGKATIGTAGYIAAGDQESTASTVNIAPTVNNGSARYIVKGTVTNNTSGGTSTATINRGSQIKIGAGYYPSDLYYTAQSNASGTLTLTTSHNAQTDIGCDGYSKVKVTGITMPKDKGFTVVTTADTVLDTTSDLDITNNAYRRVDITNAANGTVLVANSGNTTVTSGSTTTGNLTVSAYGIYGTAENDKPIVSEGKWVATVANDSGVYYGKVSVPAGGYSASVSSHSVTTTPVVTGSISGTITSIGTTTKPSGTDGTNYWTITPGGSVTTTGVSTAKGKATISTAGYLPTSNQETEADTVNITPTVSNGTARYIPKAVIAGSSTNATATTTVAPGTVSVSKQDVPSGVTQAASGNATTTAPSSGVYVAVKATAAANSTGTTSSISGSGSATVTTAGYAPSTLTGSISVSGTATAKTSAKDSSVTYVPITTATPAFDGGTLSGGSTATGTNVTLSTTDNGMKVQTAYTASRTAVLYNGAVAGWVNKADDAEALASASKSSTNGTAYYVTAVTMPKDKGFTVTTTADTALDTTSDLDVTNNAYRRVDVVNKDRATTVVTNGETLSVSWTTGKYLTTNGDVGSTVNISSYTTSSSWKCAIINCVADEIFFIKGAGGITPRLWCFCDSSNKILSKAAADAVLTYGAITAPANTAKLIINTSSGDNFVITKKSGALSVTNRGGVAITSAGLGYGRVYIQAYGTATSSSTSDATIVDAGIWKTTTVSESGTFFGRVVVNSGTITNNTSGGTSSGTINRGSQIKIGKGYYASDAYYTAQANSGTKSISSSGTTSVDGYANVSVPSTSITQGTTTVSGTTATRGTATWGAGWITSGTMAAATFANSATSGTTYVDISSTTSAPVLVAGNYLYINKGYTDNLKISLAKLVPDGSDVKGHGEYILSGHSAYDNDGTLVAGTIPTIASTDLVVDGKTVTVPIGKYTGASGATAVSASVGDGAYTAVVTSHSVNVVPVVTGALSGTITDIGTETQPSSGTDGTDYWTITPSGSVTTAGNSRTKARATISTSGWIEADSYTTGYSNKTITPTVTDGTNRYILKGTVTNNTSGGTSTATINRGKQIKIGAGYYPSDLYYTAQSNASGTLTLTTSHNAQTDISCDGYSKVKATGITVPKDLGFTVITTADSALDTTSDLDITNNAYRRVDIINQGNGTVIVANNGNTSVNSGSTTAGNLTVSAYNGSTAENNKSIVSNGKWVATTVSNTGTFYGRVTVNAGTITNNTSGGSSTGTINRGKQIKIGAGFYPSDKYYTAQANNGTLTLNQSGTTSCDGYQNVYVAAASYAETSGQAPTMYIGRGNQVIVTEGYCSSSSPLIFEAESNSGTVTISSSGTASCDGYASVSVPSASPTFKGGAVSGTATASSSTGASLSTSTNNSGVTVVAAASATRAKVQYNAAVNGWVTKAASADAYAAGSATALTGTTYYLNGVTLTAPSSGTRTFSVTVPNGATTATFVFNVDSSGNVTITES